MATIQKSYWVYMLLCDNNSYYTGFTDNLTKRFQAHLDGSSRCKYTRSFKPICILQNWQIESKSQALQIERYIKSLSHSEKENLIQTPTQINQLFNLETPG